MKKWKKKKTVSLEIDGIEFTVTGDAVDKLTERRVLKKTTICLNSVTFFCADIDHRNDSQYQSKLCRETTSRNENVMRPFPVSFLGKWRAILPTTATTFHRTRVHALYSHKQGAGIEMTQLLP